MRISILFFLVLLTVFSFSNCTEKQVNHTLIIEEHDEDYGCLHENHSQYDDGDSLNLEAVSNSF